MVRHEDKTGARTGTWYEGLLPGVTPTSKETDKQTRKTTWQDGVNAWELVCKRALEFIPRFPQNSIVGRRGL